MRALLLSAALLAAAPALADETTGTILAYDRVAGLLVLEDKTVWELSASVTVPEDLVAGDRVRMVYTTAGEDGLTSIDSLTRAE
ncbi:hypothetical protein [Citreimonas salinaria]|uniref:DUF1344 domain-containing protein n=1 Tax=Citreimonas salinaria TaxID=321339 RepID=A0A1H3KCW2_9RHOB|nr:hypothetical protein [Citreimonas salinaria]SDY49374.1 hypothetical protein SAMN05444340_10932 [Citreimonas salinaria]